jgi:hypothetical protein
LLLGITVTVTGWAHKATLALRPFLIYFETQFEFLSFLMHPPELSGNYQQIHPVAKQEKFGDKWPPNFVYEVSFMLVGLTWHKVYDIGPTALLPLRRKIWY